MSTLKLGRKAEEEGAEPSLPFALFSVACWEAEVISHVFNPPCFTSPSIKAFAVNWGSTRKFFQDVWGCGGQAMCYTCQSKSLVSIRFASLHLHTSCLCTWLWCLDELQPPCTLEVTRWKDLGLSQHPAEATTCGLLVCEDVNPCSCRNCWSDVCCFICTEILFPSKGGFELKERERGCSDHILQNITRQITKHKVDTCPNPVSAFSSKLLNLYILARRYLLFPSPMTTSAAPAQKSPELSPCSNV